MPQTKPTNPRTAAYREVTVFLQRLLSTGSQNCSHNHIYSLNLAPDSDSPVTKQFLFYSYSIE